MASSTVILRRKSMVTMILIEHCYLNYEFLSMSWWLTLLCPYRRQDQKHRMDGEVEAISENTGIAGVLLSEWIRPLMHWYRGLLQTIMSTVSGMSWIVKLTDRQEVKVLARWSTGSHAGVGIQWIPATTLWGHPFELAFCLRLPLLHSMCVVFAIRVFAFA